MSQIMLREYGSVSALVDQAERQPVGREGTIYDFYSRDKRLSVPLSHVRDSAWSGDMSLQDALHTARYGGWSPQYAEGLRGLFDDLVPRLRAAVAFDFERRLDYAGDQVDIQSYVDGMPEQFNNWFPTEQETKTGVVTILVGVGLRGCTICASAACSAAPALQAEDVFLRGQALIGLVRSLRLLGFELEIWTEYSVRPYRADQIYTQLVNVQHAGQVTDEGGLEFALGHPAYARKVHLRAQECEDNKTRQTFHFGSRAEPFGSDYSNIVRPQMSAYVGADITIDMGDDWFGRGFMDEYDKRIRVTDQDVLNWVVAQLQACGVLSDEKAKKVLDEA